MSQYTPSNLVNTRISKILVAIDGSEHSFKASEYALELAKSFGAQLYAVTVTYIPASDHRSQKEVLSKSLVEDSSNNSMKDAGNWFENLTQNACFWCYSNYRLPSYAIINNMVAVKGALLQWQMLSMKALIQWL